MKKIIVAMALCLFFVKAETHYVDKAMDALKEITVGQVDEIATAANSTESKNEENLKGFVLSTQIKTFSDIPKSTDQEITRMKEEIQLLIRQVALDIEMNNENKSGQLSVDEKGNLHYEPNPDLPDELNRKKKMLLEGNMKNQVSIRSASLALNLLGSVNKEIIEQAKAARSRKEKERLYMKQAIYVYEISDIVLSLLNELTLDGKNSIEVLHKEAQKRVARSLQHVAKQKKDAQALRDKGIITEAQLTQELDGLSHIEKANERSLEAWKGILEKVSTQEEYLKKLKLKKEFIAYKQGRAKLQIETLRDLRGVAALKDSIGAIDDLVGAVENLDLLVLDDRVVTELLGE